MRRRKKGSAEAARVRHLICVDAQNVMTRLAARHEVMVQRFSRHRDRSALVEPLATWFTSITFSDLATLEAREQRSVSQFYEGLADLRWYLSSTEDMPNQVQLTLGQHLRRLENKYEGLRQVIGLPEADGAPVVDAEIVGRKRQPRRAR